MGPLSLSTERQLKDADTEQNFNIEVDAYLSEDTDVDVDAEQI